MSVPDIINGTFECVGGLLCWLNVRRLMKDRKISGVFWPVSLFFSVWGAWNLFYYPHLQQWFSFVGGLVIVTGNSAWVCLAIKWRKNK